MDILHRAHQDAQPPADAWAHDCPQFTGHRPQGMTTERMAARKAKLASWLRQGLIRLGPTFIKIGQQFSTRVDVLAPEFVKVRTGLPLQWHLRCAGAKLWACTAAGAN